MSEHCIIHTVFILSKAYNNHTNTTEEQPQINLSLITAHCSGPVLGSGVYTTYRGTQSSYNLRCSTLITRIKTVSLCCFAETGNHGHMVATVVDIIIVHILTRNSSQTPVIGFLTTVKSIIIGCVKRRRISSTLLRSRINISASVSPSITHVNRSICSFFLVVIITFNALLFWTLKRGTRCFHFFLISICVHFIVVISFFCKTIFHAVVKPVVCFSFSPSM